MRDKIAANKPNLKLIETILFEHNKLPECDKQMNQIHFQDE